MKSYLEPEFAETYQAWKDRPSPDTNSQMLKVLDPVISSGLTTFAGGNRSPTLRSKARMLVLNSLPRYDQSKSKLRSFAMNQLQGLRRLSSQESQIISLPERLQLDAQHLSQTENEMRDWLGRDPSEAELADKTGLSTRRLQSIRRMSAGISESSMPVETEEGGGRYNPAVIQPVNPEHWREFVYQSLNPIDQLILEHSLGLNNKPVLSNLALARRLGFTAGAVSQRKSKIQEQLDQTELLGGVL